MKLTGGWLIVVPAASIMVLVGSSTTARAQTPCKANEKPCEEETPRTMAGHRFVVPQPRYSAFDNPRFPSPFSTTDFAFLVGAGFATSDVRVKEIFPELQELDVPIPNEELKLASLALAAAFQGRLMENWTLRANVAGSLLVGASEVSILAPGAFVGFEAGLGTTASVRIGERVRIAGSLDFEYDKELQASPADLVISIVESGFQLDDLLQTSDDITIRETAQVAVTIHKSLGALANFQLEEVVSQGEHDRDRKDERFATGPALDFDIGALVPQVPIGILANYTISIPIEDTEDLKVQQILGTGISYTGRSDLILAIQLETAFLELDIAELTGYDIVFRMQYFW